MSPEAIARKVGLPDEPFGLAKNKFALWLICVNESAGVVVGFVTLVVNSGDRFPALKLETVAVPAAHGLPVEVRSPPVPPCTQFPGVRALAVTVPPIRAVARISNPLEFENDPKPVFGLIDLHGIVAQNAIDVSLAL
jgi:hypothetical protein